MAGKGGNRARGTSGSHHLRSVDAGGESVTAGGGDDGGDGHDNKASQDVVVNMMLFSEDDAFECARAATILGLGVTLTCSDWVDPDDHDMSTSVWELVCTRLPVRVIPPQEES